MSERCLHVRLEMVQILGTRRSAIHPRKLEQYRKAEAISCCDCPGIWPYSEPEDLPHWLYVRLKEQGRLPGPALTADIMKALRESARAAQSGPSNG